MTGFTDAGFKLCIIVENIDVFFDVRCPKDEHIDKFAYNIMSTMDINELIYRKIDTVETYPLFGFHERLFLINESIQLICRRDAKQ